MIRRKTPDDNTSALKARAGALASPSCGIFNANHSSKRRAFVPSQSAQGFDLLLRAGDPKIRYAEACRTALRSAARPRFPGLECRPLLAVAVRTHIPGAEHSPC